MNKVSVWRMMWTSSLVRVRQYGICLSPKCSRETHNELTSIWRKFRSSLQRLVSPVFQTSVSVTWRLEDKVAPYCGLGWTISNTPNQEPSCPKYRWHRQNHDAT